jgi:hypothetical protein
MRKIHLLPILSLFFLLLTAACGRTANVGDLQTESQAIEAAGAESAAVEIEMGVGQLTVNGGAAELLDATFTYNVAEWQPQVNYAVTDGVGNLEVSQSGDVDTIPLDNDIRNEWQLNLNDEIPLDMLIRLGAGESQLSLATLNLRRLTVEGGAGEANIDLGGSPLESLTVTSGVGETTIDLTGIWENDLDATITGGVGELTLRLPRNVGVRVVTQTGIGDVNANGFTRDGDAYVNDAYGQSAATLTLNVSGGIGAITLELGE